jgi:hypothetical protein
LQHAWLLAASRVSRELGDGDTTLTAPELARALRIDEPRAELLLAEASVHDFVHSSAAPARLRVTELTEPAESAESTELDSPSTEAARRASASKP